MHQIYRVNADAGTAMILLGGFAAFFGLLFSIYFFFHWKQIQETPPENRGLLETWVLDFFGIVWGSFWHRVLIVAGPLGAILGGISFIIQGINYS